MDNLIVCKNITKIVGKYRLEGINFELKPGYILGVIGRNGSGKTSLLRTLMGSYKLDKNLYEENTSDILINDVSIKKDIKTYKEQFAFVFCETPFDKTYTSLDNGKVYGRYYKTFDMDKYISLLEKFDVPIKRSISKLSKGQQIKQQLAFALSYDAKVYFFDEPTGNLDVEFRDLFYKYIREIVEDGEKCVIYASHLVEEMEEFADYILWIEAKEEVGRMKFFGNIDELRNNYRIVEGDEEIFNEIPQEFILGGRKRENHSEVLVDFTNKQKLYEAISKEENIYCLEKNCRYASLKEIMYYIEKGSVL